MSNGRDETAGRGNDPQFDSRQADVPLPGFALPVLTLDQRIRDARQVVIDAKGEHDPVATFLLFSGGNDSLVLLDVLWNLADAVFHVETGIGIKQTDDHARQVAARYDLPYIVGHPPESYDSLVLGPWNGMPEPGAHRYTYIQLKERCIEALIRDHRTRRGQRFLLLTGVRRAESKRRMGHSELIRRKGGQVWVNPLLNWPNDAMLTYRRSRHLPINPVSEHLHMSGECLCGAMADQDDARGERALIRLFYPDFDSRLSALEAECRRRGLRYTEWGVKREVDHAEIDGQEALDLGDDMLMCSSCEARRA